MSATPRRMVCLSAESADWLWRLGAWENVAGITACFKPSPDTPPKPRVGGFSDGRIDAIVELEPDLVITYSDVQADLTRELVRKGLPVLATNQRTLGEIESTLSMLSRIAGRGEDGDRLLTEFRSRLVPVVFPGRRPRVYFEEWDDPLISGIGWVSELIERAGGQDVFASTEVKRAAAERVISSETVRRANPEILIASWCGKPIRVADIQQRAGWKKIDAVRAGRIFEIAGEDILQPGFRLVFGFERLKEIFSSWTAGRQPSRLQTAQASITAEET